MLHNAISGQGPFSFWVTIETVLSRRGKYIRFRGNSISYSAFFRSEVARRFPGDRFWGDPLEELLNTFFTRASSFSLFHASIFFISPRKNEVVKEDSMHAGDKYSKAGLF
jgi:hypothetical protein